MGFPKGYVEEAGKFSGVLTRISCRINYMLLTLPNPRIAAVDFLFATIQQGYMQQFLNDPWTKDHKLLELCKEGYSGNFHKIPAPEGQLAEGKPGLTVTFSVENRSMIPHIEMAPPQVTKKVSHRVLRNWIAATLG